MAAVWIVLVGLAIAVVGFKLANRPGDDFGAALPFYFGLFLCVVGLLIAAATWLWRFFTG